MVIIVIVNAGYSSGTENTHVFVEKAKQNRAFTADFHLVTVGRDPRMKPALQKSVLRTIGEYAPPPFAILKRNE
jgi:predicted metal-dependent RNase